MAGVGCEVGVAGGGQDASMAEDFLHLQQINARLNQVSGITVAQTMGGNLFFTPQASTTLRMVT